MCFIKVKSDLNETWV